MFQDIIDKSKTVYLNYILRDNKPSKHKTMDSTKIFKNDIENPDVRKRSAPQFFVGDTMNHRNIGERKLGPGEASAAKQPNGYYKGNNYNGENKYGENIIISATSIYITVRML